MLLEPGSTHLAIFLGHMANRRGAYAQDGAMMRVPLLSGSQRSGRHPRRRYRRGKRPISHSRRFQHTGQGTPHGRARCRPVRSDNISPYFHFITKYTIRACIHEYFLEAIIAYAARAPGRPPAIDRIFCDAMYGRREMSTACYRKPSRRLRLKKTTHLRA